MGKRDHLKDYVPTEDGGYEYVGTHWSWSSAEIRAGFLSRARMGSFDDAVRLAQASGQPADTAAVRRYRSRSGISINLEQQLRDDLGVFARAGFADGDVERHAVSVVIDATRADRENLALLGLLFGGVRNVQAACSLGLGFLGLDQHSVC